MTGIRREKRELVHWQQNADSLVRLGQVSGHRLVLMCPTTTSADVDRHRDVFEQAADALVA